MSYKEMIPYEKSELVCSNSEICSEMMARAGVGKES